MSSSSASELNERTSLLAPRTNSPKSAHHNDQSYRTSPMVHGSIINEGDDEEMVIYGYRPNLALALVTWILIVGTAFILRLTFYWRPQWMLYATHSKCSLAKATKVLLVDRYAQHFVETVNDDKTRVEPSTGAKLDNYERLRFFENKKLRYIWDESLGVFIRLYGLDKDLALSSLPEMFSGLTVDEQTQRRSLYGPNAIQIQVQSYTRILFEEVLGPFYIFQLFSMTVWLIDDYRYYAACIIIMSALSLVSGVVQIRRNQQQLRDTVESVAYVQVCRPNDQYEQIDSSLLVPGDVVVVPTFDTVLQFDGILINGNVIVNESMLTGESVPITKTPISGSGLSSQLLYDPKEHSKHTLYCGTRVLQTRYYRNAHVKALVVRSGFQTAKGELIRSIMFPKPVDFRFNRQINRFIGLLGCLALIGFTYTVILKSKRGASLSSIILSALDLFTIVVPPALPASMTIGIIYAQSRLKKNKIYCISPRSINISGSINCVCFDKTGTLTEDHLVFNEVVPVDQETQEFEEPFNEDAMCHRHRHRRTTQDSSIATDQSFRSINSSTVSSTFTSHSIGGDYLPVLRNRQGNFSPLMECLASCHSLTTIEGKIIGDPLELQMFHATGWQLEEPEADDNNKFDLLVPTVVKPPPSRSSKLNSNDSPSDVIEEAVDESDAVIAGQSDDEFHMLERASSDLGGQHDVGILRQFQFSSSLQRMSVVTRRYRATKFVVYTKGAPEKIAQLCEPDTVPDDFGDVLVKYTRRGYRVLALAYRELQSDMSYARMQRASREQLESNLKLLGLLTFGNLLKPETSQVIARLNSASIRSVMVTGDNMLTALSVACDCQMIARNDKIIMLQVMDNKKLKARRANKPTLSAFDTSQENQNGPSGDQQGLYPTASLEFITDCTQQEPQQEIERAAKPTLSWSYVTTVANDDEQDEPPTDKAGACSLQMPLMDDDVEQFDRVKQHVAITGETWDTIRTHYPELMDAVCMRGTVFARMAPDQKQQLVEHLQSLQYYVGMCGDGANDSGALRSAHAGISLSDTEASVAAPFTSATANITCIPTLICEGRGALVTAFGILKYMALYSLIQFCSVIILYSLYYNLTDIQFLYIDLFIITLFVALFGRTHPYPKLAKVAPSSSLLSLAQLSSVAIQIVLMMVFQVLGVVLLWRQPWYVPHTSQYDKSFEGHDNYTVFAVSVFQYITLAIVYSKGKPFRRSIMSNRLFFIALILMTSLTITTLLIPSTWNVPYIAFDTVGIPMYFKLILLGVAFGHFICAMLGERVIVDRLLSSSPPSLTSR